MKIKFLKLAAALLTALSTAYLPLALPAFDMAASVYAATTFSAAFTYNSKTVKKTAETGEKSTYPLFDVLAALDIEGTPDTVEVTGVSCLTAEKKNGVWYLTMENSSVSPIEKGTLNMGFGNTSIAVSVNIGQDSIPVVLAGYLYFDKDGGDGTLTVTSQGETNNDKMYCYVGRTYKLPECTYTREGHTFAGWEIRGQICQPGDSYAHIGSTTAKALWKNNSTNEIVNQSAFVDVSLDQDLQHGTFTVPSQARKGEIIDIIPVPDSGYYIYSVTVNGNKRSLTNGKATYTMTDAPAVISGEFKKALAGGTEASPALLNDNEVYFLTGGWYKVSGNITFNHEIIFTDDVHLVLEDGCEMKIQPASQVSTYVFKSDDNNDKLYIYGNTGKLSIPYSANSQDGIGASYVEINGGNISLNSYSAFGGYALRATNGINIKSGNVTIDYGQLYSHSGDVIISGGVVKAPITSNYNSVNISGGAVTGNIGGYYVNITGGQINSSSVYSEYSLILGCNAESDSIKIGQMRLPDRSNLVTKIADGIILKDDESKTYQGSLTKDEMSALAGKTLTFSGNCDADFNVTLGTSYYGTVTADKTTAKYNDKVKLTVTPKTGFNIKSVKYNDTEIVPDSDGKYSFNMPRSDVNVSAEFEKKKFTVTWKNYDGKVLEIDENVEYGSAPFYDSATPVKAGAAFKNWDKEFSAVTKDVVYTAVFEDAAASIAANQTALNSYLSYCVDNANNKTYILFNFTPAQGKSVTDYDHIAVINKLVAETADNYIIKPAQNNANYIDNKTGFINTVYSKVKFSDGSTITAGNGSYIVGIAIDNTISQPDTNKFDIIAYLKGGAED